MVQSRSQGVSRREVQQLINASVKSALERVRELDRRLKVVERGVSKSTIMTARRPTRSSGPKSSRPSRRTAPRSTEQKPTAGVGGTGPV